MEDLWRFLISVSGGGPIELIAVALGLTNIVLLVQRSIWSYPFGMLMVILYAKVFYDSRLYSDALLHVFFLVIQVYGLWYWLQYRQSDGLVVVERSAPRLVGFSILAAFFGAITLGTIMRRYTDADLPYWDASVAATSVVAQFLMSRRRLESWLFWIAVDVMAIALFWTKGLYPTALLYTAFLVLCVWGYLRWSRAWRSGAAV